MPEEGKPHLGLEPVGESLPLSDAAKAHVDHPQNGYDYLEVYYGLDIEFGDRVETPEGEGVVIGAASYVYVNPTGETEPEPYRIWHPDDVQEVPARG